MDEAERLHKRLVDRLVQRKIIRTPAVEAAFRAVPRHLFLPGVPLEEVYRGDHVITKEEDGLRLSSSTAPWLMAGMLEQLAPKSGQRLLEVGTGTGYNAAILAHLVGENGRVLTVDVDGDVVEEARQNLERAGFANGDPRLEACTADGFLGDPEGAPWDGILVTVRTGGPAPAWIEQLAPGGRMVVPWALRGARHGQISVALEALPDHLLSRSFIDCGFIRPRGQMALAGRDLQLGDTPGLLWSDGGLGGSPEEIRKLLEGPRTVEPTGVDARFWEISEHFQLWLVAHEPGSCSILAEGPWADWDALVPLMEQPGRVRGTGGLFDGRGLALLALPAPRDLAREQELQIVTYGHPACAQRLRRHLERWQTGGRPSRAELRIRCYPGTTAHPSPPPAPSVRLPGPWGTAWIDWPG